MTSKLLPEPARTWLDGTAFNLGWFALYPLSAILLWNGDRGRRGDAINKS